jgi:hypothetical protein
LATFLDDIGDFLGLNKGKATSAAATKNQGVIDQLGTTGRGIIGGIQDTTGDYLGLGKSGANLRADALGVNGAEGNTRAVDAFHTNPGYEFARDQGLDAIMRNNSALGRLQSGNTDVDLMKYATGFADQNYNDWLGNLSGYDTMYGNGVQADNTAAGLGLDFESGLASGKMGANNQFAAGKEAGQGAGLDLLSSIAGIAGNAFGYGGFGGSGSGGASVNPRTGMPPIY